MDVDVTFFTNKIELGNSTLSPTSLFRARAYSVLHDMPPTFRARDVHLPSSGLCYACIILHLAPRIPIFPLLPSCSPMDTSRPVHFQGTLSSPLRYVYPPFFHRLSFLRCLKMSELKIRCVAIVGKWAKFDFCTRVRIPIEIHEN